LASTIGSRSWREVVTVTASPDAYDGPLSAMRNYADDLGAWLGIWVNRSEPDAHDCRRASDAVDAIDAMLRDLHQVRARLVGEIRDADDTTAARLTRCCAVAGEVVSHDGQSARPLDRGRCSRQLRDVRRPLGDRLASPP